jgi:hypothetical protein
VQPSHLSAPGLEFVIQPDQLRVDQLRCDSSQCSTDKRGGGVASADCVRLARGRTVFRVHGKCKAQHTSASRDVIT